MATSSDSEYLLRAAELAERGALRVAPNPTVGCVIVRNGQIVGEGFHARFGEAHAERNALEVAGKRSEGATAYVTLEPCDHHGRQPPCTDALIEAGIAEVVYAHEDPLRDGIRKLKAAGIRERKSRVKVPAPTLGSIRPWVIAKWAMTLDGRIATQDGDSKWISDEAARDWAHREFRGGVDAIIAGAGTVRADEPALTNRSGEGGQPLRVLVCGRNKLPKRDAENTLLAVPKGFKVPGGFESAVCGKKGRVKPRLLLKELADRGVRRVLLEGGPKLLGSFFAKGLVDQVVVFVGPKIVGGTKGPIEGWHVDGMSGALELEHARHQSLANTLVYEGIVARP
ncbi:MAG: bifunctional diaminohydroxyphosphoribosylaminopyrimidine deaminase/5-amino-6-(5-phosphoribosylamino)uracil reductase RibD [Planctomycetota bacterium]